MLLIRRKCSNLIENSLNQYRMFSLMFLQNKYQLLLLACLLLTLSGNAQPNSDDKRNSTNFSKMVSGGINIPFVEYNQTYNFGVGANFSWSKQRFGWMHKKLTRPLGFIAGSSIDYYFGKTETISGYSYKYNGFTYIQAYGGGIYNCGRRGNITLTTGPALGLEYDVETFFWGINLRGTYFIKKKIAIISGIKLMKDPKAYDPLFSFSLQASIAF